MLGALIEWDTEPLSGYISGLHRSVAGDDFLLGDLTLQLALAPVSLVLEGILTRDPGSDPSGGALLYVTLPPDRRLSLTLLADYTEKVEARRDLGLAAGPAFHVNDLLELRLDYGVRVREDDGVRETRHSVNAAGISTL